VKPRSPWPFASDCKSDPGERVDPPEARRWDDEVRPQPYLTFIPRMKLDNTRVTKFATISGPRPTKMP
jgi:hypothetical protein